VRALEVLSGADTFFRELDWDWWSFRIEAIQTVDSVMASAVWKRTRASEKVLVEVALARKKGDLDLNGLENLSDTAAQINFRPGCGV